MLRDDIDRYIGQRHLLGFVFRTPAYVLRHFGRVAHVRGETVVHTSTVLAGPPAHRPPRSVGNGC